MLKQLKRKSIIFLLGLSVLGQSFAQIHDLPGSYKVGLSKLEHVLSLSPDELIIEIERQEQNLAELSAELSILEADPNTISTTCEKTYEFRNFAKTLSAITAASLLVTSLVTGNQAALYGLRHSGLSRETFIKNRMNDLEQTLLKENKLAVEQYNHELVKANEDPVVRHREIRKLEQKLANELPEKIKLFQTKPEAIFPEAEKDFIKAEKLSTQSTKLIRMAKITGALTVPAVLSWVTFKYLNSHEDYVRLTDQEKINLQNSISAMEKDLRVLKSALMLKEELEVKGAVK